MNETFFYLVKFMLFFLGILLLVFFIAVLTPKIAAKVDKLAGKIIKSDSLKPDKNQSDVKSIYDLPEEKNNDTGEIKNGEE